ncbi:MAG: Gfo/Idh/MocA family oxidoreductase [Lentisphaeria bacterium]|nr:Gfo/Idh/MocA family oxidoreductase [Lentisphaeria bacterium]
MLKLGIVGLSEGNGHPYSWSAIINGDYDEALMEECGYPVIPAYLRANRDTLGIDGARVTHVWTQDRALSERVARTSGIAQVCTGLEDMIGEVDAVLLARDDPENHVAMARPFVEAGMPLFVDKPLAFCREDLSWFEERVAEGRFLMSCSALRYSAGVQGGRVDLPAVGDIRLVVAVGAKDLRKYAIHTLEGMFALLGDPQAVAVRHVGRPGRDVLLIDFADGSSATVHVFEGITGADLSVYGSKGVLRVNHGGTYPAFRACLVEAIRSFEAGRPRLDFDRTRNVIHALIGARESLERDGVPVRLIQARHMGVDPCMSKSFSASRGRSAW